MPAYIDRSHELANMSLNDTIGRKVFNVWREERRLGTVVEIEQGCNGGARVPWDDSNYVISMSLRDLALVEFYPLPGSRLSDMKR